MRFQKIVAYGTVCGLVSIGAMGFLNREALAKEANNWHVLPQPERLTELYFTEPHKLPDGLTDKQTVTFTVHNLERQITTYNYAILSTSSNTDAVKHMLGKGTFTLNQNQLRTTSREITVPLPVGRTEVRTVLSYRGFNAKGMFNSHQQSIHYWVGANHLGDDTE